MNGSSKPISDLVAFRKILYDCLRRRSNALFELYDAVLTAATMPSTVHLSLTPTHRRGWVSLYAVLSKGHIDAEALRDLLAAKMLVAANGSGQHPRVYAVDVSA
jgi:hypothetical protein